MDIDFKEVQYIVAKKNVLNNLNIRLKAGKINAIMGHTGSGKSIIGEMLESVIKPTKGIILVGDHDITQKMSSKDINDLRFNVGMVSQFPENDFFCETVRDEISFGLDLFNYKKNNIEKRVNDSLKMVGLDSSYLDRDPFTLSTGEIRLVALASVLAFNPKVIVFDEPTVGLDSKERKTLLSILRTIKHRYGKTVILFSHDSDFIYQLADYIFILGNGKVVLDGTKLDVFQDDLKLKQNGILLPKIVAFEKLVKRNKNIKINNRDDINDLIKDILRNY